jgi:hypothetical protein
MAIPAFQELWLENLPKFIEFVMFCKNQLCSAFIKLHYSLALSYTLNRIISVTNTNITKVNP